MLLRGGLKQARGDADKFFTLFDTIADVDPSPGDQYRKKLDQFFTDNAEEIEKLPFSAKQVERIDRYVFRFPTSIVLLKGGLKQARGDADKFFTLFDTIADVDPSPNDQYRKKLNQFFTDHAEKIEKLPFSAKQVERIDRYVDKTETTTVLLKGRKKKWEICAASVAVLLSPGILPENTE